MANHMQEVAKMLGVELGEEFMCSNGYKYVLREYGATQSKYDGIMGSFTNVLNDLLTGKLLIERKFYKPATGEEYWAIYPSGRAEHVMCIDGIIDRFFQKLGNCYRTEEEAEANRDKWVAFYASDEVLEV